MTNNAIRPVRENNARSVSIDSPRRLNHGFVLYPQYFPNSLVQLFYRGFLKRVWTGPRANENAWRLNCTTTCSRCWSSATNQQSKRPATTLRYGNIKATIWQNVSEKGPFFATTFSRPVKDQACTWRNGTSFGLNDLDALMNVAFETKEWINAHALKR